MARQLSGRTLTPILNGGIVDFDLVTAVSLAELLSGGEVQIAIDGPFTDTPEIMTALPKKHERPGGDASALGRERC